MRDRMAVQLVTVLLLFAGGIMGWIVAVGVQRSCP